MPDEETPREGRGAEVVDPSTVPQTQKGRIEKLEQEVAALKEFTEANLADIRTLVPDWRDDEPPGVLGRFGIDLDNPGTFRSPSRLLDLLLARTIDQAFEDRLREFVTNELPEEFSADFKQRIRYALDDRLAESFPVDNEVKET